MHRKIYYREFEYNMNIIKMFMNNVIILGCSDMRGSDKRGYTVCMVLSNLIILFSMEVY